MPPLFIFMKKKDTGKLGESIAKRYLIKKGYKILTTNFRTRFGEIDIICEKDGILVFVEVRTKNKNSFIMPEESIDKRKLLHIKKATLIYLNSIKRPFKGIRLDFIGVIIDSHAPQIAFDRLSAMERTANRRGYRFMIGQSHGEIEHLEEYASDFLSRGVDGVICVSHDYPDSGAEIADVYSHFKNVVFIEKPAGKGQDVCYIEVDIADGIKQAFDYLKSKEKHPASLLLSDLSFYKSIERKRGFCQAHRDAGIECNEDLIYVMGRIGDDIENEHFVEAIEYLIIKHGAKSIIALNDIFAIHTINALTRMGLSVPQDVSVIGCDNIRFASMFNPALTTIDQKQEELSEIAQIIQDDFKKIGIKLEISARGLYFTKKYIFICEFKMDSHNRDIIGYSNWANDAKT